jgi:hypothetical protein
VEGSAKDCRNMICAMDSKGHTKSSDQNYKNRPLLRRVLVFSQRFLGWQHCGACINNCCNSPLKFYGISSEFHHSSQERLVVLKNCSVLMMHCCTVV